MLDKLMLISLKNRMMVLIGALIIFIAGFYIARNLPVDVFPDLTAPTVTIMTMNLRSMMTMNIITLSRSPL